MAGIKMKEFKYNLLYLDRQLKNVTPYQNVSYQWRRLPSPHSSVQVMRTSWSHKGGIWHPADGVYGKQ